MAKANNEAIGFPVLEVQSPYDTRLHNLETIWPVIVKKLQDYDKVMRNCESVKSELEALKASLSQNENSLTNHSDLISKLTNKSEIKFKEISNKISEIAPRLDQHGKNHLEIKSHIQAVDVSLTNMIVNSHKDISDSLSKYATVNQVDDLKKYVETQIATIYKSTSVTATNVLEIIKKVNAISDKNLEHASDIYSHNSKTQEMNQKISSLYQLYDNFKAANSDKISSSAAAKMIESKMTEFKNLLDSLPNPAVSIKDELLGKLNIVALDGNNSLLKSSNNAQKIAIMEKKIENLYLLVNKLELNK